MVRRRAVRLHKAKLGNDVGNPHHHSRTESTGHSKHKRATHSTTERRPHLKRHDRG